MSITSSQTTVQLKSMTMGELRDDLTSTLEQHQLKTTVESMYDDELIMTVARNPMIKTVVKLQRIRHRPLDLVIQADYKQVGSTKDVIRVNKPSQGQNDYSFQWLWVPLLFGGLLIAMLNYFGDEIALFLGSEDGLSVYQLVGIVLVFSIIIAVSIIYGVPAVSRKKDAKMKEFDEEILDLLSTRIDELDKSKTPVSVRRCWSCFEQLDLEQTSCPACGRKQK